MPSNPRPRRVLFFFFFVSLPSLCACIFVLELGLRLFVPVSDPLPRGLYDADANLLISEPHDQGTYIKNPDINADYLINSAGWNSPHEYTPQKQPGVLRIAVIGDSYVESMEVDLDKSFLALLETTLAQASGQPVEVYNFGKSGAPLSEYLQIMRYVTATYAPDIVIVNIVDNDFEESFVEFGLPYFLNFDLAADGSIVEIPPVPYEPSKQVEGFRVLAHSALVRFLAYNLDYLPRLKMMRMNEPVEQTESDDSARRTKLDALVRYVFGQYADLASGADSHLLLVIDGPRADLYKGRPLEESDTFIYHDVSQAAVDELGIPLLDLTTPFAEAYSQTERRLNFENDYHWNEYGHQIVAQALADELLALEWVSSGSTASAQIP